MRADDPESPRPRYKAVVLAGRVVYWTGCALALAPGLYGVYLAGMALFVLMPAHRPTASSLTLAMGVLSGDAGWVVYLIGALMRRVLIGKQG